MTKNNNPHAGHRQRLKDTFLDSGLDGLSVYQVLELLLYYAVPQKDTNELAHALIDHFGSLHGVLDAEYERLLEVPGIGPHAASLITLMPALFSRYAKDSIAAGAPLDTVRDYVKYLRNFFIGKGYEEFYLVCMDNQRRVKQTVLLNKGSISEVQIYPRIAVEQALLHKTRFVLLAHNHPGGNITPSSADVRLTDIIRDALAPLSISVTDHVIIGADKYFSFAEKGLLRTGNTAGRDWIKR